MAYLERKLRQRELEQEPEAHTEGTEMTTARLLRNEEDSRVPPLTRLFCR